MLDLVLIVLAVFLSLYLYSEYTARFPPGPRWGLPVLGHLLSLSQDPRVQFRAWRKRYGEVFSFYLGRRLVVVLYGYDVIREALVKNADVFSERPRMFITELITNRGIVFNSGPQWKKQRKLSIELLRVLGAGRHKFALNVQQEIHEFLKAVRGRQGQASDLSQLVMVSVSNNICNVVFGRRFDYDCESFLRYLDLVRDNFKHLKTTGLVNYLPWLRFLPGDRFSANKVLQNVAEMERSFLLPQIQHHLDQQTDDTNDDDDAHDDFISAYLKQIKQQRANGTKPVCSDEEMQNLLWTVSDLFVAGTETLTSSLLWTLIYLLHHPAVQHKCFQQVTDVIGLTSPPSLRHRPEMTYVEATIMEVLRLADISGMGLQHGVTHSVSFRGYRIPESAVVIPLLHSALNDEAVWGDPHCFRPERFLDDSGALVKKEQFIPFSVGRRACPGERIARQQLFLYVTSLIQAFHFLPAEEGQLPSLQGIMGFTNSPAHYSIRAVPRSNGNGKEV